MWITLKQGHQRVDVNLAQVTHVAFPEPDRAELEFCTGTWLYVDLSGGNRNVLTRALGALKPAPGPELPVLPDVAP